MAYKQGSTVPGTVTQYDVLVGGAASAVASVGPGSAGQVLQSGGNAANPAYSTATYPTTATGTGTLLRADGTNWVATTSTYPNTNAINTLLYASSANVMSALATANSGVLVTNGSGVPSIGSKILGSNGGGLIFVSSQTASASASISFTSLTAYPVYVLEYFNVQPATSTQKLQIQVSNNNGVSYVNTGYACGINYSAYNTGTLTNVNSTSSVLLTNTMANSVIAQGYVYIFNTNVGSNCVFLGHSSWNDTGAATFVSGFLVGSTGTTGVNAIQLTYTSGNIGQGTFNLYGFQNT